MMQLVNTYTDDKVHMGTHPNEKPFKCNYCSKNYAQKSELNNHEKVHANKKEYKCEFCGKGFNTNGAKRLTLMKKMLNVRFVVKHLLTYQGSISMKRIIKSKCHIDAKLVENIFSVEEN